VEGRAAVAAVGERRADELAEELRDALLLARGQALRDPRPDLVAALGERRAVADAERAAQRLGE